jgi:hypothetical protein
MQRERRLELLRWICVLPAAVTCGIALRYFGGVVWRLAFQRPGAASESSIADAAQLLVYAVAAAVFVLLGAFIAPRSRSTTALVLAVAYTLLSLRIHVVSQDHPGRTNYLHLAAETAGVALGIASLFSTAKRPAGSR